MSRVALLQTSLRRLLTANDAWGQQFLRAASTQAKETSADPAAEPSSPASSPSPASPSSSSSSPPPPQAPSPTSTAPSKPANPDAFLFEDEGEDDEAYQFDSYKTPRFTAKEKDYLDHFRPEVDPRLSKIFRGYTALDEGTWTIPYSKKKWYTMKQIYGHYDEVNDVGNFYLHPRSLIQRILRDPVNLKKDAFDTWKERRDVDVCKAYQIVDEAKLAVLGPELLAAHFVTSFGGKVKFHGFKNWFDQNNYKSLPQKYGPEFFCEAIDLSGTPLFYEGMSFLMRLSKLRSLNLANCTALDEWAIARLYPLRETLIHLDLSGCHRISDRGVMTLWKMKRLRRLILSGLEDCVKNLPYLVMELEELLPDCYIHGVDVEREPNPQVSGIPDDYDLSEAELLEKYGGEITNVEWEKWWGFEKDENGEKIFDAEKFSYAWRGRRFKTDWDDLLEDLKQESGWLYRILTVNPWGRPRGNPKRRI